MRISDWSSDVCSSDLPIGKELAGINDCSGRRDDGVPGHFWRFEFRMGIMVRDGLTVIMVAVGHNRIAVIQAFFDQVDFIAALGTHLMFPETAIGIERKPQYISVPQRTTPKGRA